MCILHSGSRVIRHRSFWNWFLFLKGENVCLFSQLSWKLCNVFNPTNLLSACCTSQETQETHYWEFQVVHRWRWSPSLVLEQFLSPCTWYYSCTWYYLVPIKKQLKTLFPWSGGQIRSVRSVLSKVCFPGGGDLFQATLDFLIYSSCPWSPRWPRIIIWMHAMHIFITSADSRTIDRSSPDGRPIEQGCISKRNFPPPYCGTAITAMIAETTESISLQEETIVLWSPLKSSYCHLYERLRLSTWGSTKDAKKFGKDEHRLVEIDSAEENRATIARIKRNSGSASLIFILRDNWMNWQKCRLLWLGFQRAQQQWKSWKRKLHKYQQQLLPATTDTKDN